MAVKFQLRRDTAANWASANTVLDVGEPGFETDTRKLKLGDGVTPWNSLDYTIIQDFDELSNIPTTLAGYGITDAATSAQGALADSASQPGDGLSTFTNDLDYGALVGTAIQNNGLPVLPTQTLDISGSVFGDDSTLIVDAVNNIVTANLTGNVTGNADTATALATARTIAGQSFDGTANITIAATDLSDTDQSLATTDDVTFNSVTGNVFTSLIDSADSSAITITPDLVLSAGLTVGNHIVPSSNENIDLGSEANRFRDIYLSGSTINLGGTTLSRHTDGSVAISDHSTGTPLPVRASEIVVGEGADKIIIRRTVDGLVEFDSQDADGVSGGLIEGKFSNLRTTGNVQIDGDLVVSGDTTTLTATNLAVSDNMLYLNNAIETTITDAVGNGTIVVYTTSEAHGYTQGMTVSISGIDPTAYNLSEQTITVVTTDTFTIENAATGAYVSGGTARARTNANPDLGFAAGYYDGGYGHAGFFRDATDGVFKVFKGYTPEPDASAFIDIADPSFSIADFQAGTGYFADISLGGTAVTATAAELNYLDITTLGTVEANKAVTADANGDVKFADGDKAIFGAGSDLQIFHDGPTGNSFITETGSGHLVIAVDDFRIQPLAQDRNWIAGDTNGAVELFYDGSKKIATTTTGADITGLLTTDGLTTSEVIKAPDGSAAAPAYTNTGDTDGGMYFPAANQVGIAAGGQDIANFSSSGVTISAARTHAAGVNNLQVLNTSTGEPVAISLQAVADNGGQGNEGAIYFSAGADGTAADNQIQFNADHQTDTNPDVVITGSGNVGIGASPNNYSNYVSLKLSDTTGGIIEFADDDVVVGEVFNTADDLFVGTTKADADVVVRTDTGTVAATFDSNQNLTVTNNVTASDYILEAIDTDISDTAVDVFVYDTRKDSDGGAWRKRTQHTSWYNETLNTSTRGSRREFPAVAVIVSDSTSNTITIYDADVSDMPMWMVFIQGSAGMANRYMVQGNGYDHSVYMLNGILATGYNNESSSYGQPIINFISEKVVRMDQQADGSEGGIYTGNIASRNDSTYGYAVSNEDYDIVNGAVNDIAMTVLPNAPIDPATGLPVPTIAVATDAGVSVIKDNGTVVDLTRNTSGMQNVEFEGTRLHINSSTVGGHWIYDTIPNGDETLSPADGHFEYWDPNYSNFFNPAYLGWIRPSIAANYIGTESASSSVSGLTAFDFVSDDYRSSMMTWISSSYNTGWMPGDIKLATLSDTDDTDVTGTELVTNGTFDSDTVWTKGTSWTITGGGLVATSANSSTYQSLSSGLTVGKTYVAEFDITSYTSGGVVLQIDGASFTSVASAVGSYSGTFTYQGISSLLRVANTTGSTLTVDNVSVRLAEEDRSVNGKGLQVFGTVTKNPVATGADLVAYSGFSTSNYLQQPYNSDLNVGSSGNLCLMGWFKASSTGGGQFFFKRSTASRELELWIAADLRYIAFYTEGSSLTTPNSAWANDTWNFVTAIKTASSKSIYINGELVASNTTSTNADSTEPLEIGYSATTTSLALMRITTTAPTAEQIRKIYEDEKVLFQENAQATLYGTSDEVTALAYDDTTELLHAGTSSGRSVFQGLRRIDNTTDAVGAAISASNGLVAED